MRKLLILPVLLFLFTYSASAQTKKAGGFKAANTPHGVALTVTLPVPPGGSGTIASVNFYRCPGTCTATSGVFTFLTGQIPTALTYLDPASGLTNGSTYTWAATVTDSSGNESGYSPFFTTAFVAKTNPNAPGLSGSDQ